jgi:CheY-like chemotaxis protein
MRSHIKPSVLVLNPYSDEREMYSSYLQASGFEVRAHEHADEALRAIAAAPPDVLILRLRQSRPGMSGIDVVRRVKGTVRTRSVAVVMISASMQPDDRAAAAAAQCDRYLLLPVLPDELAREIDRLLRRPRSRRRTEQ